jgi:hypothetical protein
LRLQVFLEVYDMQGHVFQNDWTNPVSRDAIVRIVDFAQRNLARSGPL